MNVNASFHEMIESFTNLFGLFAEKCNDKNWAFMKLGIY